MIARVLTIAGSDSSGGAGIEADLKTIAAFGAYGCTAITAVTAQNTTGVHAVHYLPGSFVKRAIETVLGDIGADAVKIGMLGNAEILLAVAASLPSDIPIVLDPVMVATSGAYLLTEEAISLLREALVPRAALITPNLPETLVLTGIMPEEPEDFERAGNKLLEMGSKAVLIKGGHGAGEVVSDVLIHEGGMEIFTHPRIPGRNTHGTGCTLAAAIATGLAQGMDLAEAVRRACRYLRQAIAEAPGFGKGFGPVWHGVAWK